MNHGEPRYRPVDVAREHYRTASWLKLLEKRGVLPEPRRDSMGRRFYTPEDRAVIRARLEQRRPMAPVP